MLKATNICLLEYKQNGGMCVCVMAEQMKLEDLMKPQMCGPNNPYQK